MMISRTTSSRSPIHNDSTHQLPMKFKYLLPAIFLYSSSLYVQHTGKNELPVHITRNSFPFNTNYAVSSIEIVTVLKDSTTIGYTGGPEKQALIPETSCSTWLQQYVNHRFRKSFSKKGAKLMWLIRDINIGTDVNDTALFQLQLQATAYQVSAENTYKELATLDTLFSGRNTGAGSYGEAIATALCALYNNAVNSVQPTNNLRTMNVETASQRSFTSLGIIPVYIVFTNQNYIAQVVPPAYPYNT